MEILLVFPFRVTTLLETMRLFASRVRNINYMGFVTPQTTIFLRCLLRRLVNGRSSVVFVQGKVKIAKTISKQ